MHTSLLLKPEKCEFHKEEVNFLGYIVTTSGIRASPEKVRATKEWPTPYDVKSVQSFLGFTGFNRQFIKDYSKIALPLTEITKKTNEFNWTAREQRSFEELRDTCADPPMLCTFRTGKPTRIEIDASDLALGACILQ